MYALLKDNEGNLVVEIEDKLKVQNQYIKELTMNEPVISSTLGSPIFENEVLTNRRKGN